MNKWYEMNSKNDDVVVSSRIRLARNLANYRFADRISAEEAVKLIESVSEAVKNKYNIDSLYIASFRFVTAKRK